MGLRALFPTSVPALLPRVLQVKLSVVEREVPHDPNDVPLTQWQDLDPHRKVVAGVGAYPFELEGLEGLTLRSFDGLAETTGRSVAFINEECGALAGFEVEFEKTENAWSLPLLHMSFSRGRHRRCKMSSSSIMMLLFFQRVCVHNKLNHTYSPSNSPPLKSKSPPAQADLIAPCGLLDSAPLPSAELQRERDGKGGGREDHLLHFEAVPRTAVVTGGDCIGT